MFILMIIKKISGILFFSYLGLCSLIGYIDLSKRRVSPEEVKKCEEKFNKAKTVCSEVI